MSDSDLSKAERIDILENKIPALERRGMDSRAEECRQELSELQTDVYGAADPDPDAIESAESIDLLERKIQAFENRGMDTSRLEAKLETLEKRAGSGNAERPTPALVIQDKDSTPRTDGGEVVDVVREDGTPLGTLNRSDYRDEVDTLSGTVPFSVIKDEVDEICERVFE